MTNERRLDQARQSLLHAAEEAKSAIDQLIAAQGGTDQLTEAIALKRVELLNLAEQTAERIATAKPEARA